MNEDKVLHFIKDHRGVCHGYTEAEFHRAIMEQSAHSDYNWCAPVTEISKATGKFCNQIFRDDICRAVLDCYSRLFFKDMVWNDAIEIAIWKCFVRLSPDLEENQKSRDNYADKYVDFKIGHIKIGCLIASGGDEAARQYSDFANEKKRELFKCRSVRDLMKFGSTLENSFERTFKTFRKAPN